MHLTSFDDATLIGITVPHVLADMEGISTLLEAWLDQKPPNPVYEIGKTPFDVVDSMKDDGRPAAGLRPAFGLKMLRIKLSYVGEMIWGGMREEERTVYLPAEVMALLRRDA